MRPLCGPEPFTKRMLPSAAVSFSMPPEIDKAKALLYITLMQKHIVMVR